MVNETLSFNDGSKGCEDGKDAAGNEAPGALIIILLSAKLMENLM